jgi:hypothetical protein
VGTRPISNGSWLVAIACCAALAGGCQFKEYPFWWQATGEQAAAFRLSLEEARDRAFVVLRLTLHGEEGHGPSPAGFWEEAVLALHLNMGYQPAVGYAKRQYTDGRKVNFLLKGWIQPAEPASPKSPVRIWGARYLLSASGIPMWETIVGFEMEILDTGQIVARGR